MKYLGLFSSCIICVLAGTLNAAELNVSSKFDVEIYGYIKLDASYDTQRTAVGDMMFFVLPEGSGGRDSEFNMTAKQTRLGMNIRVPEVGDAVVSGKVEMDFYGSTSHNSPSPRLRLGYMDAALGNTSFRAGQDWEAFVSILPIMVNFATLGDSGSLGIRRPQFRVTQVFDLADRTKIIAKAAVARTIGQDIDGGGQDDGAASGFPTAQGNIMLETPMSALESPIRIGVSGHYGQEKVAAHEHNDVIRDDSNYDTWSVIGNLFFPLLRSRTGRESMTAALQGTVWTGENLDTYLGGIGQGINVDSEQGIRASGGWAQLVLHPMDRLNLNVGYGIDDPKDGDLSDGARARNVSIFTSIFYDVLTSVTVMFEYTHIKTEYKNTPNGVNNRFHCAVRYSF